MSCLDINPYDGLKVFSSKYVLEMIRYIGLLWFH